MVAKRKQNRLSKNFHRTFIPEKKYLGALLQYAAENGRYDLKEIAAATEIPTGASSGKAIPTADYCIGMGLVTLVGENRKKTLKLTTLGRTILLEDKFFREPLTQWIAHFNLCNKNTGAEIWYQLFWVGMCVLGEAFKADVLNNWICPVLNITTPKAMSPTIRMYNDEVSFINCNAIKTEGDLLIRSKAPIDIAYVWGYGAWITTAIEDVGRSGEQITVDELNDYCGFRSVTAWNLNESQQVLDLLEEKGVITVDRHMRPWIICNKYSADYLWKRMYKDFI